MLYHRVLEMGFGGNPLGIFDWHPTAREGSLTAEKQLDLVVKEIPPYVHYTGIDLVGRLSPQAMGRAYKGCTSFAHSTRTMLEAYQQDIAKHGRFRNFHLENMDSRQTIYPSNRFDEVHLHWVLSDPTVSQEDAISMVTEAKRVLRPGGSLIITGEKFRVERRTNSLINVESSTRAVLDRTNTSINGGLPELSRSSLLSEQVKQLYLHRFAAEDREIIQDAYLFISQN